MVDACSACGGQALVTHLRVAGRAGPEGLIPTTDRFGSALSDIQRCADCGHMQLDRFPTEAALEEAYGEAASTAYLLEEAGQRETARRTLALVERHATPGSLLDLGCWVGFLLDEARARGWETLGIEPSAFGSAYARDQLGLDVIVSDLIGADVGKRRFQAIVLGDVIEHLPNPGAALDRVAALLAPGGVVTLLLPDAGSRVARLLRAGWWSVIPTHVQYFTRRSLSTLLERHGFHVVHQSTAPKAFTVRYYLERLDGYSHGLGRMSVRAAEMLRVADRMWAPDFRDRMVVIARR